MGLNVRRARWTPWAALVLGMAAEIGHHQVLSDMLRFDCTRGGPTAGTVGAVLALATIAAGIALSLASVRGLDDDGPKARNRRFVARLSVGMASVLAIAVAWQTLAMFLLPECVR